MSTTLRWLVVLLLSTTLTAITPAHSEERLVLSTQEPAGHINIVTELVGPAPRFPEWTVGGFIVVTPHARTPMGSLVTGCTEGRGRISLVMEGPQGSLGEFDWSTGGADVPSRLATAVCETVHG